MGRVWAELRRLLGERRLRPRAFRLLRDSAIEPSARTGTTVYELIEWDHGCAAGDTEAFGLDCISVTLRPDGQPPFFVVPVRGLAAYGRSPRYGQ